MSPYILLGLKASLWWRFFLKLITNKSESFFGQIMFKWEINWEILGLFISIEELFFFFNLRPRARALAISPLGRLWLQHKFPISFQFVSSFLSKLLKYLFFQFFADLLPIIFSKKVNIIIVNFGLVIKLLWRLVY